MKVLQKTILYIPLYLIITCTYAQEIAGSLRPEIDTSYVSLKYDNWSLRLLTTYKHQNIFLSNATGETVKYVPNDQLSTGVGFSYKNLIIDLGVRLLFNRDEFTSRVDLQSEIAFQEHLVGVLIQRYKGFNKSNANGTEGFRDDMRSWVAGINYLYNFNPEKISIRSVITGNRQQKKSAGTLLLGGFISFQDLNADTTLVTSTDGGFNEYAEMESLTMMNIGIMGGYAFITPITKHFFFFGGLMPGLGLNIGEVDGTRSYNIPLGPMAKVNTRAAFGYIGPRWYSGVHYSSDYYIINTGHDNLFRYNIGKFKLVLGYKFPAKNTIIERIFGQ